jgi:FKBP-type peptidyl-prolyl cis-trans isomerase FkpA
MESLNKKGVGFPQEISMKKVILLITLLALSANIDCAEKKPTKNSPEVMYAIGYLVGGNLKNQLILQNEDVEFKMFSQGIRDSLLSKPAQVDVETYKPLVRERYISDKEKIMEARKKEQTEYIEKLKKSVAKSDQATVLNNDVVKDVVIEILAEGNGDKPTRNDIVKVHYEGKLIDGTIFDSSIKRNQPAEFPLTGVIPCWTEAFQLLKKGAKARLTCPSDTAYGSNDMGTIPPYSTLIFEVELLDIIKK